MQSLFKKINSDPNEVDKVIEFAIRSTYFLFVRPHEAFTSFLEDIRRFNLKDNQKVIDWWIKPRTNNIEQNSIEHSIEMNDDHKKTNEFINFFESAEEKKEETHENRDNEESAFYSAKENDYSRQIETQMDYFEDSDILIANESQYSVEQPDEEPEKVHSEENKAQNIIQKQQQELNHKNKILKWWNQKIVLMIELLDITTCIQKLQCEKVLTAVILIYIFN